MGAREKIREPIAYEMEHFEDKFREVLSSNVPLLDRIMYYIVRRKGKQMRPMFVFLTAKMLSSGGVFPATYRGAALIELIHTASLIHDDVVDDSDLRRGFFSINAIWKNKIAVLVGDFLLSKGLMVAVDHGDFDILKIISDSGRQIVEGELLQIEKARKLNIDEATYYEVIRQKTAILICSCCMIGARSVGASDEVVEKMRRFGEMAGMAFQIKDDLFDYTEDKIGKPTGIDIKEQKMTLPLIHVINKVDKDKRKWLIHSVKKHNLDKKRVKEVIAFVRENGGLEYAVEKMNHYKAAALALLGEFEDSSSKDSLIEMVNYVTERRI